MKRRSILLTFLLAIFFASCNEDQLVDTTVMPEETTTGKNTFGCLVNGWLYVGGRYSDLYGTFSPQPSIYFVYNKSTNKMNVEVKVKDKGEGYEYLAFTINEPVENEQCTFTDARWLDKSSLNDNSIELGSGTVKITKFNENEKIISGRFYSNENKPITHGRFDVQYR